MARASTLAAAALAALVLCCACAIAAAAKAEAAGAAGKAARPRPRPPAVARGLSWNYYKKSCPHAEAVVHDFLKQAIIKDPGLAAGILRLHFHDCFVHGCDASILLDGYQPGKAGERTAPPNLTLRRDAVDAINDIRDRLDMACGGAVVSCADILTLAARDSVVETGGPWYKVPLGRRDSIDYPWQGEVNAALPRPESTVTTLLAAMNTVGLDAGDLVAPSGAHTIGVGHCTSFEKRLYPQVDATMDAAFAASLKQTCPAMGVDRTAALDVCSADRFDNNYFVDLVNRQGLLTSDQDLFTDGRTRPIVQQFAGSQEAFFRQFAVSMVKMGKIKVLTGNQGQVRRNCKVPNPPGTAAGIALPWSVVDEAETGCLLLY